MNIRQLVVALVLTPAIPVSTMAQQQQSAAAQHAEACQRASEIVDRGTVPSARPEALAYLPKCGARGGRALAQELKRWNATSDSTALLHAYYQIARLVDASVFAAAIEMAEDQRATAESRIIAFKLLVSYKNPALTSLPFSGFLPGNSRTIAVQDHFGTREGSPLPENWESSAHAVLDRVARNSQESETIRHAARRALSFFRQ
jgi:hypothetical protein